jgi:hypothetical protein
MHPTDNQVSARGIFVCQGKAGTAATVNCSNACKIHKSLQ